MRNYTIFLKKELFEAVKTHKLLIMGVVFLFFGMISPLFARFMPEIMRWAIESDPSMAGMDLSGFFNEPGAFDSWVQFYGNIGQMGFIVLVLIFSGMISSELSKGTLTIMLSKGLSRSAVILAKLTSAFFIWTASFVLSALTAWGYTVYMFDNGVYNLPFALFCLWVFGVFLLALTALAAALTKKGYACMLIVGAVVVLMNIINMIPFVRSYNPLSLLGSLQLLNDTAAVRELYPTLAVSIGGVAVFTLFAVMAFDKKR